MCYLIEKIHQLEEEVARLQRNIKAEKEERIEDAKKCEEKDSKKENEIHQLRQMNKRLMESEHSLQQAKTENERCIKELEEKYRTLETQRDAQNDTIRRLMRDVEFSSGQEEKLESELFKRQEKIKQLEENIEAERSSHLETKFNFELLQVRIKELEATDESLRECRRDLDNISRNYKELQQAMDQQVEACNELRNVIERKDHQHAIEVNEMSKQIKEMTKRENVMSEQLDVHQSNFNALKDELHEAKKHQTNVESTYNFNMKELEGVLNSFKFDKANDEEKKREHSKRKRRSSSVLLEDLRFVLREYQTRLVEANTQVETLKKSNDSLTSESQRWRQRLKDKDKILEETRTQLKNSHMDSARYKAECLRYENDRTQHSEESNKMTRKLGDMKEKYNQLHLQFGDMQETLSKTHEDHEVFLYGIYQHLITGHPFIHSRRDRHLTSFSVSEICQMIQEQLDFKLNALRSAEEKVSNLEKNLEDYREDYEKLKYSHEKNANNSKQKEGELKQKINELEDQYKRKVNEIQKKTDKSKVTLDEVWVKLDKTKQSREELKSENTKLKDKLTKIKSERDYLNLAGILLSGSLQAKSIQVAELSLQKLLSNKLIKDIVYLKQKTVELVDILRTEISENDGNLRPKSIHFGKRRPMLLQFRRAVVVILAVNRFWHHARYGTLYISIGKSFSNAKRGDLLAIGCKDRKIFQYRGLSGDLTKRDQELNTTINWLTNPDFITVAMSATCDLLEELKRIPNPYEEMNEDDCRYEEDCKYEKYNRRPIRLPNITEKVVKSCKSLFKGLSKEFPSSIYETRIPMNGDTLAYQLGVGLRKILHHVKDQEAENSYQSSTCLAKTMNSHLLSFIERLHTAEVERRYLRQDVTRLKGEREDIEHMLVSEKELRTSLAKEENSLRRKVEKLQKNMRAMVDATKYDALLIDMKSVVEREEKAQKQLKDYASYLEDIEKRVEQHSSEEKSKDSRMRDTLKMLNNAKNEINRRDDIIQRLKKDAELCEKEKVQYQSNLELAEKAYKIAVREREIVASYFGAVGTVLEQSRQQVKLSSTDRFDFMLPELILPNEILVMDGIQMSTEMLTCQDTVRLFYQAQNSALQEISKLCNEKEQLAQKIDILSEEIRSQRDNVMQIRGEMNALKASNAGQMREVPNYNVNGKESLKSKLGSRNIHDFQYPSRILVSSPPNGFVPLLSSEANS